MEKQLSLLLGSWLLLFGGPSAVQAISSDFFCPPKKEKHNAYAVPLGSNFYLPIFASHPPGGPVSKDMKQAIIVMHGAPRSAMQYFRDTLDVVDKQHKPQHTVVIAPAIPDKPCEAGKWSNRRRQQVPDDFKAPTWDSQREWMFGGGSDRRRRRQGMSSFDALDTVVDWTQEEYPNLDRVVVTGFSAGGQMVLRWAVMSPEGEGGKTRFGDLNLRIIIGSPSTVLYLNEDRPKKSCRPDKDQGQYHSCKEFFTPSAHACGGDFDKYGFGLKGLHEGGGGTTTIRGAANEYMHWYLNEKKSKQVSKKLRERFATKDVRFVFGSKDTRHCDHSVCSNDCGAMLQGTNRLQRGLNYMGHLKEALPNYTPKYSIFYGGHDNYAAFLSHDWILWALPYNDRDFKVLDRVVKHEGKKEEGYKSRYFAAFECMSRCENDNGCNSFTYNPFSGHCDLFDKCVTTNTAVVGPKSHEADEQTYYKSCSRRRNGGKSRLYEEEPMEEDEQAGALPSLRRPGTTALFAACGVAAAVLAFVGAFATWRTLGPSVRSAAAARDLPRCLRPLVDVERSSVLDMAEVVQVE